MPDTDAVPGPWHDEPAQDLTDEQLDKAPNIEPVPDHIREIWADRDQADDEEPAA